MTCQPSSSIRRRFGVSSITTNTVEAHRRQIRHVTKTKSSFPSTEAARKLLYLATVDTQRKWNRPLWNWPKVLNQLGIRFEDRIDF